jgi:hypothetical protein
LVTQTKFVSDVATEQARTAGDNNDLFPQVHATKSWRSGLPWVTFSDTDDPQF